jgi:hypothetical protein
MRPVRSAPPPFRRSAATEKSSPPIRQDFSLALAMTRAAVQTLEVFLTNLALEDGDLTGYNDYHISST